MFLVQSCSFSDQTLPFLQTSKCWFSDKYTGCYLLVFTEGEDGPAYMTDVDNKKINDF